MHHDVVVDLVADDRLHQLPVGDIEARDLFGTDEVPEALVVLPGRQDAAHLDRALKQQVDDLRTVGDKAVVGGDGVVPQMAVDRQGGDVEGVDGGEVHRR